MCLEKQKVFVADKDNAHSRLLKNYFLFRTVNFFDQIFFTEALFPGTGTNNEIVFDDINSLIILKRKKTMQVKVL